MNIHELLCIGIYGGSQVRIQCCSTLAKLGRLQEVGHSQFMINIVILNLKIAWRGGGGGQMCPYAAVQLQRSTE